MEVFVDDDSKLTLHGLQQHYVKLRENEKNRKLFHLLDVLEFNQVMITDAGAQHFLQEYMCAQRKYKWRHPETASLTKHSTAKAPKEREMRNK